MKNLLIKLIIIFLVLELSLARTEFGSNQFKEFNQGFWNAIKSSSSSNAAAAPPAPVPPTPNQQGNQDLKSHLRQVLLNVPEIIKFGQRSNDIGIRSITKSYLDLPINVRLFMETSDAATFINQLDYVQNEENKYYNQVNRYQLLEQHQQIIKFINLIKDLHKIIIISRK